MSIGNRFGNIGNEKLLPILDPFMKREKVFREISFHRGLWRSRFSTFIGGKFGNEK